MSSSDDLIDALLNAYRDGVFPMAESADDPSFAFYKPYQRGLLPIRDLHIPKKLLKTLHAEGYEIRMDTAFADVIDGCARTTPKRKQTWINPAIHDMFLLLHKRGHAHSIEVWAENGTLMGGLYGLSIGAVFCGESMVSFARDASKIALVYLCALLWKANYTVLDTQFINPHLLQFGAYEIPQDAYEKLIKTEMQKSVTALTDLTPDLSLLEDYLVNRDKA